MMSVNIDLVFGNGYHKAKTKKTAKQERLCREGEVIRKCTAGASEQLAHTAGKCVRKVESPQVMAL